MQVTLKTAVMAALAVGAAVASAGAQAATISITSPTIGNSSQLVFWVNDVSNSTTYADVLTQTVGSVFTAPGNGAAGTVNTYTGSSNFSLGVGGDSSLVSFINAANAAGQTLQYGITGGASTNSGAGTNTIVATGTGPGAASDSFGIAKASLPNAIGAAGWSGDVSSLSAQTTDGSGFNATLSGIIGTPQSKSGTAVQYYGYYPDQANLALNQSATLYAITNQQGASFPNGVSFALGTVSLTGSGASLDLSFTGNGSPPPVPLPAAVWLLGSGLLGLAGVARRRDQKTQAA
jgi:hypothetical protein